MQAFVVTTFTVVSIFALVIYLRLRDRKAAKCKAEQDETRRTHNQLSMRNWSSHRDHFFELAIAHLAAKTPTPKFKLGQRVQTKDQRTGGYLRFLGNWEILDPTYFNKPESGTIRSVSLNTTWLEERFTDTMWTKGFEDWLAQKHGVIHQELSTMLYVPDSFVTYLHQYLDDISAAQKLYYSYRIDFDNPSIGIRYELAESFLDGHVVADWAHLENAS